jgi:hypothetical protein
MKRGDGEVRKINLCILVVSGIHTILWNSSLSAAWRMELWNVLPLESKAFGQRCITLRITEFLDSVLRPKFTNTTFRKLDLFPSSCDGRETRNLLGPLERANLSHWSNRVGRVGVSLPSPEDGNKLVSETLWFLVFIISDDGQSPETQ